MHTLGNVVGCGPFLVVAIPGILVLQLPATEDPTVNSRHVVVVEEGCVPVAVGQRQCVANGNRLQAEHVVAANHQSNLSPLIEALGWYAFTALHPA